MKFKVVLLKIRIIPTMFIYEYENANNGNVIMDHESSDEFEEGYCTDVFEEVSDEEKEDECLRRVFRPKVVTDNDPDFFSSYHSERYHEMLDIVNEQAKKMFVTKQVDKCPDAVWNQWRRFVEKQSTDSPPPEIKPSAEVTEENQERLVEWAEQEMLKRDASDEDSDSRLGAVGGAVGGAAENRVKKLVKRRPKRAKPEEDDDDDDEDDALFSVEVSPTRVVKTWSLYKRFEN